MKFTLQKLAIPIGCTVVKNEFSTYNPQTEFSEEVSLTDLTEDLLQFSFNNGALVVDLGWYGDYKTNEGFYRLVVIKNTDWDNPLRQETSKSQVEITKQLDAILLELQYEGTIK